MHISPSLHPFRELFARVSFLSLFAAPAVAADSILVVNPSFQADNFPAFPGYVGAGGNPAEITGWIGTGGRGVNGTDLGAGTPFADNGLLPDNNRVAFIQGAGSLSQTLNGFEVGQRYWVQVFGNARNCCGDVPTVNVTLGSSTLLPDTTLNPVGVGQPYNFVNLIWTADSTSAALTFNSRSTNGGDASVAIDGISVIKRSLLDIVIVNPSFEASGNSFGFPGYIAAPFGPAGWTRSAGSGQVVINGSNASGNPFSDNGVVPEGQNVLGLQQDMAVSQTLIGLASGQPYRLTLDYNSRTGDDPTALIQINGQTAFTGVVPEVGSTNPYYHLSFDFIAAGTSTQLSIANLGLAADSTLLVDNIRVVAVPEPTGASLTLLGLAALAQRQRRRST
jgi:MYXO-CTERM domain-containing protein